MKDIGGMELPMVRQLFQLSSKRNGTSSREHDIAEAPAAAPLCKPASESLPAGEGLSLGFDSFEEIYRRAPANPPRTAYSILKVAEMLNSPHLAGMSAESRRASVMMAIEAAGVDMKDILQDAMLRQRALDDYEEAQQKKLQEFESAKVAENRLLQADLDRITAEYMSKVQANVDEVARHQDAFRAWQKRKQAVLTTLAGASACCSQSGSAINSGFGAAMEHMAGR